MTDLNTYRTRENRHVIHSENPPEAAEEKLPFSQEFYSWSKYLVTRYNCSILNCCAGHALFSVGKNFTIVVTFSQVTECTFWIHWPKLDQIWIKYEG